MLRKLRESAGYTQTQLAKKSGVNIRQIQRYESQDSDVGNMTLRNAIAIADALSVDVREFIKGRSDN